MSEALGTGKVLKSSSGNEYKIIELLGEGGQGFVYKVECNGKQFAMKWYKTSTARKEQKDILKNLLQKPKPAPEFLWPLDLVEEGNLFGYIMPLREKRFKDIPALLTRKVEPSFYILCKIALNMVTAYRKLHASGYSYCDINFGNLFYDPDTGDVLICDNDNVSVDGMGESLVGGTLGFMAPEIVMSYEGGPEAYPSTNTDLFSLAVLLFYMFMMHHPLEGEKVSNIKCFDYVAKVKVYGKEPIFIFDPNNKTNRPVRGEQDNAIIFWNLYPEYFKNLFVKTFTDGMHNPNVRVQEIEWQNALIKMIDSIVVCPGCEAENFFDDKKDEMQVAQTCWCCNKKVDKPVGIKIGKKKVFLNQTTKLTEHHLKDNYNFNRIVATVNQNPKNPSIWGLRNDSDDNWTYVRADGSQTILPPGKSATIAKECKIKFGQVEGLFE